MPARMQPLPSTPYAVLNQFVMSERASSEGCYCPVCNSLNVVKKYRLMRVHFRMLERMLARGVGVNVHWRGFVDPNSATKMLQIPKHYGFIGQNTINVDNPFNRSGGWHITPRGAAFILGQCRVPYYFWSIHDVAIWWALGLGTAPDLRQRLRGQHPKTLVEEMQRAALNQEFRHGGQWRIEYLDGRTEQ